MAFVADDAAFYIGVSPSKFDQFVFDGTMPRQLRAGGCVIWDVRQLDQAFDDLADAIDHGVTINDREAAARALDLVIRDLDISNRSGVSAIQLQQIERPSKSLGNSV